MRIRPLIVVIAGAAVLAAGSATANALDRPASTASTASAQTLAAPYVNTFERPAANAPYLRDAWSADGWNATWDLGMANRGRIDGTVARSGGKSLRVSYPKGVIGPENSGVSAPFGLTPRREYYFSQWVRFSPDFSWGTTEYGGKIGIGLAGGASCSGGQVCDGFNGFSSRMIWRSGGRASLYYYHMGHAGTYGDAADFQLDGRPVHYPRGQWINLVQRVKVNTVTNGQANPDGEIEAWYNGRRVVLVTGLRFVRNADLVDRAYFSSFFGGATASFAPQNDSVIWYDDFKASAARADMCEISGGCAATPTPPPATNPAAGAWAVNTAYRAGQTVTYGGASYRCVQAHTSLAGWEPPAAPALWQRV